MTFLNLILAAAGLPLLACTLYLLTLTVLSLRTNAPVRDGGSMIRFRVVVPAHNEEQGLARTLWSLRRLDYPQSRFQIVVVADNCTDRTAQVARECGARVMERHDTTLRGKGYALQFAFDKLAEEAPHAWNAAVVVDADTQVTPNLLQAFANRLGGGERAVQAAYLPAPSGGGALSMITEIAFTAFHVVRSTARERLGLSVGLRGNGMAFDRSLLAAVPHDAFSRTEDLEFGLRLGLTGARIAFATEATVYGDMPSHDAVATTQRSRWIGGRVELARAHVGTLIREALRRRSAILADLALDLLVPPVSVLMVALAVGSTLAGLFTLASGSLGIGAVIWFAASGALALHVGDAARRAGRLRALLTAPRALSAYALEKLLITIRSFQPTDLSWVRTARPGESR